MHDYLTILLVGQSGLLCLTVPDNSTNYPKAPEDFRVTMLRRRREKIGADPGCYFGFDLTWKAPSDESKRHLTGFLVKYSYMHKDDLTQRRIIPRVYSVNSSSLLQSSVASFSYDCGFVFAESANETRIELFSLPQSLTNANYKIAYVYQQKFASANDSDNASDWKASIVAIASKQDSTVDVWFYQAPKGYNFTNYSISLSASSGTEYEKYVQPLASEEEARLLVRFQNVRPNMYQVQVRPIHPHSGAMTIGNIDMQKSKPSQHTSPVASPTSTQKSTSAKVPVSVTLPQRPAAIPSSSNHQEEVAFKPNAEDADASTRRFYTTTQEDIKDQSKFSRNSDPNGFVALGSTDSERERLNIISTIVAVAVLIVAAAIIVAVAFAVRRRKKPPGSDSTVGPVSDCEETKINVIVPKTTWPIPTPVSNVVPVPVSSVLLIYSSDVKVHRAVVTRFATFLQHRCSCDVRYDAWAQKDIMRDSALDWFFGQVRSVQNIVVVNSVGGRKRFDASLDGVRYEKRTHDTPMTDLFLPAMMEFRREIYHRKVHRFFHVYFPYASVADVVDLNLGQPYEMMQHLEDLFLLIHGLSKYSREGINSAEMINAQRYVEFEEGKALAAAIGDACKYFKANANWFDDVYRVAADSRATNHNDASACDDGKATGVCQTSIDSGIAVQGSGENSSNSKPSKTGRELEVNRPALNDAKITAEDLPSGLFIAPRFVNSLQMGRGVDNVSDEDNDYVDREINPMLGRKWVPPRMDDGTSLDGVSLEASMGECRYESDDNSEGFGET